MIKPHKARYSFGMRVLVGLAVVIMGLIFLVIVALFLSLAFLSTYAGVG